MMQWKVLLFVTLFEFFLIGSVLQAQSIFDPFGLRNRHQNQKDSSMTESSSEEDSREQKRRLPFSFFNPFGRNRDRSDTSRDRNGRRQDEMEDDTNSNRRSHQRQRPTQRSLRKPPSPENEPFYQPESRMGPGSSSTKPDSNEAQGEPQSSSQQQRYGVCGPSNILCNEDYIKELGLKWSPRVHNGTGIFMRDPNARGGKRFEPVGIDQPDERYGYCKTPRNERGICRHLEHCVQDEFRSDFIRFLQYKCDIPNQNYVGVCCPEEEEQQFQEREARTSTQRPRSNNGPFPPEFPPFPFLPPPPFSRQTTTTTTTRPPRRGGSRGRSRGRSHLSSISPENCGITGNGTQLRPAPRIVGGRNAKPDEWPWMVALLKKSEAVDYRAGQYCGGVLISEFHVLTAGHCIDGFDKNNLAARIGEYDFSRSSETTEDIDLAEYFVHENYNRYTYQNDIAVLKLAKSAYFHPRIKSICLPREDDDEALVNQNAFVAGFGTIYYGGPASDVLQEITVPIWSQEECQEAYTQTIEETNLCAGARAGSRDSCQGDSGGPLQLLLRGRFTVVGIVSWGIKCSEPGFPGVYTRTSKYLRWIAQQVNR